jgi:hypothetical protein
LLKNNRANRGIRLNLDYSRQLKRHYPHFQVISCTPGIGIRWLQRPDSRQERDAHYSTPER